MTFQPGDVVVYKEHGPYNGMVCAVIGNQPGYCSGQCFRPLAPTPYVREYLQEKGRTFLNLMSESFKLLEETT